MIGLTDATTPMMVKNAAENEGEMKKSSAIAITGALGGFAVNVKILRLRCLSVAVHPI